MPVSQDHETGKWRIGNGAPRYLSKESATAAYDNYLKRGGEPVKPAEKK